MLNRNEYYNHIKDCDHNQEYSYSRIKVRKFNAIIHCFFLIISISRFGFNFIEIVVKAKFSTSQLSSIGKFLFNLDVF